jgi:hypothetical protein
MIMSKITVGKETLSLLGNAKNMGANASVLLVVAKAATNGKDLPAWAREVPDAHWQKVLNLSPTNLKKTLQSDSYATLRSVINANLEVKWTVKQAKKLESLLKIQAFADLEILNMLKERVVDIPDVVSDVDKLTDIFSKFDLADIKAAYAALMAQTISGQMAAELANAPQDQATTKVA